MTTTKVPLPSSSSKNPVHGATDAFSSSVHNHKSLEMFLLVENPSKGNNLGAVLRCATAFGIRTVVAVGYAQCAVQGSHGASKHVQIVAFPQIQQAVNFVRNQCQCGGSNSGAVLGLLGGLAVDNNTVSQRRVPVRRRERQGDCGGGGSTNDHDDGASMLVEAVPGTETTATTSTNTNNAFPSFSYPIYADDLPIPRHGNVCWVISKDLHGLPVRLASHCDVLVHVPHASLPQQQQQQPTTTTTTSPSSIVPQKTLSYLDLPSTLSICLHHWATTRTIITTQHQQQQQNDDNNNDESLHFSRATTTTTVTAVDAHQVHKFQVQPVALASFDPLSNPNDAQRQNQRVQERRRYRESLAQAADDDDNCMGGLLWFDDNNNGDY